MKVLASLLVCLMLFNQVPAQPGIENAWDSVVVESTLHTQSANVTSFVSKKKPGREGYRKNKFLIIGVIIGVVLLVILLK